MMKQIEVHYWNDKYATESAQLILLECGMYHSVASLSKKVEDMGMEIIIPYCNFAQSCNIKYEESSLHPALEHDNEDK